MSEQEHDNNEITRDEIKKEFQLERMILFSDAVFAIVITLMAIEIKLPHSEHGVNADTLPHELFNLLPLFLAYCVSFFFIGAIWFQHLKMFSLLKDYDTGLIVRNLVLLFFIGLFPFSASVITRAKGNIMGFMLYMSVILLCIAAQYFLYHYIIVKRPSLRITNNIKDHLFELYKRKMALIGFTTVAILTTITTLWINDPQMAPLATLWMVVFPIIYRIALKKKKNQEKTVKK